jgi:F-type H+-transporting ATPase subunit delta
MKTNKQIERMARQLFRLCLVNSLADEGRVHQVVGRVIEGKRRGYVALLSYFLRLVRLDRAAHTATVETAVPLPADLQAEVQARLARVYGQGINTQFGLEPALIGGMRISVGSDVYDGSVQCELATLEKNF